MNTRDWSDDELGASLLARRPEPVRVDAGSCVPQDLVWDLVRGALDTASAEKILDHAAGCPDCTLALRVARAFSPSSPEVEVEEVTQGRKGSWVDSIRRLFMMPVPAFAAVVPLLLAAVVAYQGLGPRDRPPTEVVSPPETNAPAPPVRSADSPLRGLHALRLTGDLSLRGETPRAPIGVRLGPSEGLVLKLYPDVEDLPKDASAPLVVSVFEGESVVATAPRRVSDMDKDESLSLLIDTSILKPGSVYRVELAGASAYPDASGPQPRILLRQSFRFEDR